MGRKAVSKPLGPNSKKVVFMSRDPFQVLVLPYYFNDIAQKYEYAVFQRYDASYWQFIAGGGETGETILESAKRESWEEAKIPEELHFFKLETISSISVNNFKNPLQWGGDIYVIPEYCFAVEVKNKKLFLSDEHIEYQWSGFEEAFNLLKYDGNKTALWELNQRLLKIAKQ